MVAQEAQGVAEEVEPPDSSFCQRPLVSQASAWVAWCRPAVELELAVQEAAVRTDQRGRQGPQAQAQPP